MLTRHLERFYSVRGDHHVVPTDLQVAGNVLAHRGLVVGDENCCTHGLTYPFKEFTAIGSVNTNAAPPPARCSAQIRPCCARTMLRQIANPSPVPGLAG